MKNVTQDFRFAFRNFQTRPWFMVVIVLTLAVGIGANTAIFSVVHGVLLGGLPVSDPERVVVCFNNGVKAAGGDHTPLAVADVLDWRAQTRVFEDVGAFAWNRPTYTGGDLSEQIVCVDVTSNFFEIVKAKPLLGRTFLPEQGDPGAPASIVVSEQFWREKLSADPDVIGRSLKIGEAQPSIVAVMPASFDFPSQEVRAWRLMPWTTPTRRGPYFLTGLARLAPGATLQQARIEAGGLMSSFDHSPFSFNLMSAREFIVGDVRATLWTLMGAVTLVLLIALANVANLLLVRASSREKEISIRMALGAGRWRIVRQLLVESLTLAAAGGMAGLLLSVWSVPFLVAMAPENIPRLQYVGVNSVVLGWTALVSLLSGTIFGLVPAFQSSRVDINSALKVNGRGSTEARGKSRVRQLLVVLETALALTVLVGAGLVAKSFWRLSSVDSGARAERVLTAQVFLPRSRYAENQQVLGFQNRLLEKALAMPGVKNVAMTGSLPPDVIDFSDNFSVEGRPGGPNEADVADIILISAGYFETLGIPLREGRVFTDSDSSDAPRVAIVNETMVQRYFPGQDPIGKRIRQGPREEDYMQIVGVAANAKYRGLKEPAEPAIYEPLPQNPERGIFLAIRTNGVDPMSLVTAIRQQLFEMDPEIPLSQTRTLEDRISKSIAQPRFGALIIVSFATVALMLACIGVYAVISYSVVQRTHEIGIRIALGAARRDVLKLVVRDGMIPAVGGMILGLGGALLLTRLLSDLLFEVTSTDKPTLMFTCLVIAIASVAACLVPAQRASRIDPMTALRE